MAMASASAASAGSGIWSRLRRRVTICCDLMFFGAAVSDHRGLDGERRVFGDFESGGSGGQHGDPAHLAELQGGLDVGGVENVFDGDAVGTVLGDEFLQADGDARQARGHGVARRNFDGAADDAHQAIVVASSESRSTTPYPVYSVPQSMPRTRMGEV